MIISEGKLQVEYSERHSHQINGDAKNDSLFENTEKQQAQEEIPSLLAQWFFLILKFFRLVKFLKSIYYKSEVRKTLFFSKYL